MKITILGWNDKFQLRYELDRYEQMFKFDMENYTLRDSVFTVEKITFDRLNKLTEEAHCADWYHDPPEPTLLQRRANR